MNPLPGSSPSIMCRKTVFEMVEKAEALLPEGYKFSIYDAYRPVAVQQALWDYYRAKKVEQFPDATPEEIDYLDPNGKEIGLEYTQGKDGRVKVQTKLEPLYPLIMLFK